MLRVVLDSNALDPLAKVAGVYEAVKAATDESRLDPLITHVTVDELAEIPDKNLRATLFMFAMELTRLVPTGAFVVDVSRLGWARLAEDAEALEAHRAGNVDRTRDALIAVTAQYEQCPLVTNDKRMASRARDRGLTVWSSAELFEKIGSETPRCRRTLPTA